LSAASSTHPGQQPLDDLIAESDRVISAAQAAHMPIRLTGGLAIRRRHRSATLPPLARIYADLDLATTSKVGHRAITDFMERLGYVGDQMFNSLHGNERLYYQDPSRDRHVDIFVDAVRMCHVINFKQRLMYLDDTLSVSDLFLTKLQIVQLNMKDMLDIMAVLHDQTIQAKAHDALDSAYLEEVWGNDWPIWRTSQGTLAKAREIAPTVLDAAAMARVMKNVDALEEILRSGKKSLRWSVRARVGERLKWYELPEEVAQ
jgi:hypothetical protein